MSNALRIGDNHNQEQICAAKREFEELVAEVATRFAAKRSLQLSAEQQRQLQAEFETHLAALDAVMNKIDKS